MLAHGSTNYWKPKKVSRPSEERTISLSLKTRHRRSRLAYNLSGGTQSDPTISGHNCGHDYHFELASSDSKEIYSSLQDVPREDRWKEIVRLYLSPEYCDHPDTGDRLASLSQASVTAVTAAADTQEQTQVGSA